MFPITCQSFIAIGWTMYVPLGKVQHRVLQLVQFSNFLNFQNHPGDVYNNLWKFHRNRMNGVGSYTEETDRETHRQTNRQTLNFIYKISKTTASKFTTTFESFIAIGWTVCAPVMQHRLFQLVRFLNFQNHREHVYNNLWMFHRNRMNVVCSYTGHRHTDIDFYMH